MVRRQAVMSLLDFILYIRTALSVFEKFAIVKTVKEG